MEVLVGADPELFLKKQGVYHSGYGIIPGNKFEPFPVDNGAVQVDGMALEFNIDPAKDENQFIHNINHVLGQLYAMIPADFNVAIDPVAVFTEEYMNNQPEEAKTLGCAPDYNAYTLNINQTPDQNLTMRTAAGHIHVGFTEDKDDEDANHFMSCAQLCKQLDYFLGIPSVLLDSDNKRREMYGKAGSFRHKPYGMEYRVLSNFWLKSDHLISFVYNQTIKAVEHLANGENFELLNVPQLAQNIINENNKREAEAFCNKQNWELPC